MYEYMAVVKRVIDGDTIEVDLDLGLKTHIHPALRLLDVWAPELGSAGGDAARNYLFALIAPGTPIKVRTFKRSNSEKFVQTFDRYVAQLWVGEVDVNAAMRAWLAK